MNISFFFRRPSPVFHSIEEQFFAIQKEMPEEVNIHNHFAAFHSKGVFRRLFIIIQAAFKQSDINHITGDIHFTAIFLKKRKTILTVHDIGSVIRGKGFKYKVLRYFWFVMPFKRVCNVTVISEFSKQEVIKNVKIKEEKIIVIPDCVSPEIEFYEKTFNKDKLKILQVGTKENKNLQNLIPALEDIPCELTIVGNLSSEQIVLLEKHRVNYKNFYHLEYSEIINLYKNTDLLTFVSTYEGFGVPILEAQATGRPVITSDLSPLKEVAGKGAILIDPFDAEDIKRGILSVINDESLRKNLIGQGRENVKKYSAKAVAEMYYDLYRKLGD